MVFIIITIISFVLILNKLIERNLVFFDPRTLIVVTIFIVLTTIIGGLLFFAKRKKWKIEKIFLVSGLILGFCYSLFLVVGTPEDESAHFLRVYELSEGQLLPNDNSQMRSPENIRAVINNDYMYGNGYVDELNNVSIQPSNQYIEFVGSLDSNSPFSYLPHIIAIWIGKLLHLPLIPILFLCRILGMITCIIIIYYRIKYIPFMKKIVFFIALLPISMQSFSAVSADGITICASIALITYVLYARSEMKRKLKWRDYIILLLICCAIAVTKVPYAPLCLLVFWIPQERFGSKNKKIWSIIALGAIVACFIVARLTLATGFYYRFGSPDSRVAFIFQQPLQYITLIIKTLSHGLIEVTQSVMGEYLANLSVNLLAPYILIAIVVFALLCAEREKPIARSLKVFAGGCFVLVTILIYTSMFILWSDNAMKAIEGVSGRYFLPILLLIPLAFTPHLKIKKRRIVKPGFLYTFSTLINVYAIATIISFYI